MIKVRVEPVSGAVAVLTGRREKLRLRCVSWIRRVPVVGLVTANAGRRKSGVIVVDMAVCALARRDRVRTSQRERRIVVVECRIRPDDRVVAQLALSRETSCGVRRIRRAGVVLLMTRVAQRAIKCVVVVDVAIRALPRRHSVRTGQREARRGVVKLAVGPEQRIVAVFAGRWETSVGNGCSGARVVLLVARVTQRAGEVVVIVGVAVRTLARRSGVCSGQREARAVVVERCIEPRRGVMALLACLREVLRDVVGIGRALKIFQVTGHARCADQVVVISDVAVRALAWWNGVQSG